MVIRIAIDFEKSKIADVGDGRRNTALLVVSVRSLLMLSLLALLVLISRKIDHMKKRRPDSIHARVGCASRTIWKNWTHSSWSTACAFVAQYCYPQAIQIPKAKSNVISLVRGCWDFHQLSASDQQRHTLYRLSKVVSIIVHNRSHLIYIFGYMV